jgi:hypothetical protein
MKHAVTMGLVLALALAPALPALADEAAAASPTAQATAGASPAAAAPAAASPTAAVPDLPAVKDDAAAPDTGTAATVTDTTAPKETLVAPGAAKPETVESPGLKNFVIGFLGGAVVGAAGGYLFLSQGDDGHFDSNKAAVAVPASAVGLGLGFGLVSYLLGSTTPEEAKPPKVESLAPLAPAGLQQASLSVRHDWHF